VDYLLSFSNKRTREHQVKLAGGRFKANRKRWIFMQQVVKQWDILLWGAKSSQGIQKITHSHRQEKKIKWDAIKCKDITLPQAAPNPWNSGGYLCGGCPWKGPGWEWECLRAAGDRGGGWCCSDTSLPAKGRAAAASFCSTQWP